MSTTTAMALILAGVVMVGAVVSGSVPQAWAAASDPAVARPAPVAVEGTTDLFGVACPTKALCLAVGYTGKKGKKLDGSTGVVVPITDGTAGTPQKASPAITLNAVACYSTTNCVAVGETKQDDLLQGAVVPITNGELGAVVVASGTAELWGISCIPSSNVCEAVGEDAFLSGTLVPVTAGKPAAGILDKNTNDLYSISCWNAKSCLAVGQYDSSLGVAVPITLPATSPTTFGANQGAKGTTVLYAIACGSATYCAAGGHGTEMVRNVPTAFGEVVTITDGTLGAAQLATKATDLFGAGCPTATYCGLLGRGAKGGVGPDKEGVAVGDNNGTITQSYVTGTTLLRGAACPTVDKCIGAGSNGSGGVLQLFPDTWPVPPS